jgi:pantoate--beta-alanine ligase
VADLARAEAARVDYLYAPAPAAMYPPGFQTTITVAALEQPMDGAARPGHFRGVATVVLKLFAAVRPHVAIFGMKDYQQLQIIRRMTRDLDLGIEIVGAPIVRDPDGLALSSRNAYLSEADRARALALSRGLRAAEARFKAGERKAGPLLAATRTELAALETDYVDLRDAESLQGVSHVTAPVVLAVAARVGTTRLIDNIVLTP